jgi:ACR3 family arsenite transporter
MGGRFDAIAQPGEERGLGLAASLFGFDSGAAFATVVGVLVEVPVMLSVVAIVMRSKAGY